MCEDIQRQEQNTKANSSLSLGQCRCQNAKKLRTSKGDYLSSNDYLQLRPFSKWELLLKEKNCSKRERILSFMSSSLRYEKSLLPHYVSSLECFYFYYACAYTAQWAQRQCWQDVFQTRNDKKNSYNRSNDKQQVNNRTAALERTAALATGSLNAFYWYQIFAKDSTRKVHQKKIIKA